MTSAPDIAHTSRWLGRRWLVVHPRLRLSSYVVMLYLGCVAGTVAGAVVAGRDGLDAGRFVGATVVLLVPALVGSRLWFVLGHLAEYRDEPHRVWRREEGGSALYGGLVVSAVVAVPVLALFDLPYWGFWDAAVVTMMVGLVLTRLGCAMNGCCAGRPTGGLLGVWMPDRSGVWKRRYPSPLLEAGWVLVLLALVALVGTDLPFAGARFLGVVGAYAVGRLAIGATRAATPGAQRANVAASVTLLVAVAVAAAVLAG